MGHPFVHCFLIFVQEKNNIKIIIRWEGPSQYGELRGKSYLDHVSIWFINIVRSLHGAEISGARHRGGCEDAEGGEGEGDGGGGGGGVEGGGGWWWKQDTEADW